MVTTSIMAALLALVLGAPPSRAAEPFLPFFECQGATLDEWLRRFDGSGGRSSQALWCVFYRDDGSERVRAALRRWYRDGADERVRKEIVAILTHWGETPEETPALEDAPPPVPVGDAYPIAKRPFAPPFAPLEGEVEAVRRALAGTDRVARARAAVALVRRPEEVERVVRTLVTALFEETQGTWRGRLVQSSEPAQDASELTGHALEWCVEFAGDAADAALIGMIEDPELGDDLRQFILRQVPFSRHQDVREIGTALRDLCDRTDGIGVNALERLLQLLRGSEPWSIATPPDPNNWTLHVLQTRRPMADPALEALVAGALAAQLELAIDGDRLGPVLVAEALELATRSAEVRLRVVPVLLSAFQETRAAEEVLVYALISLGESSPALREAYVEVLDSLKKPTREQILRIPCLREHDERTTAALERLFRRLDDPGDLVYPMFFGGLLHPRASRLGGEFLDWCVEHGQFAWSPLYELGLRDEPELRTTDPLIARVMKSAITVRTRLERGRPAEAAIVALLGLLRDGVEPEGDFGPWADPFAAGFRVIGELDVATPDFLDWSVGFMLDANHGHQEHAAAMLTHYALDRHQQALLCHLQDIFGISEYVEVLACQGAASLERVAEIRDLLAEPRRDFRTQTARVDLEVLDAVLRITRPTAREQAWLAAAIEGGVCSDRARALAIVEARCVDTPAIRAAVERAASDVDSKVRAGAARAQAAFAK